MARPPGETSIPDHALAHLARKTGRLPLTPRRQVVDEGIYADGLTRYTLECGHKCHSRIQGVKATPCLDCAELPE